MPATTPLSDLLTQIERFVVKQKGTWNHSDWERLLEDVSKLGFKFDGDEGKRNLGNLLEGAKYFYRNASAAPAAKKPAAAKKAPAKKAPARKKAAS